MCTAWHGAARTTTTTTTTTTTATTATTATTTATDGLRQVVRKLDAARPAAGRGQQACGEGARIIIM